MKAIVYDRPGSFALTTVDDPEIRDDEVLLRVLVAGVCGTDLHLHDGEFGPTYPLTPGHEIVGEVRRLGNAVVGLEPGDRVVLDNTAACGHCVECRRGRPAFCRRLLAQGVNAPGGFAELVVASADRCFLVNDLEPDTAVFAEPTACVVHGLDVLRPAAGVDVLVFGAGPTGLLLTQLLVATTGGRVTVAAPSAHKLELAAALGARHVVPIDRAAPADAAVALRALTEDGFDVVVDATGAVPVLEQAIPLTRTGGTVFVYGMTPESARWPVPAYEVFRRELTIKGSFAQQFSFDRALAALRLGTVRTDGLITHRFDLEHYGDALAAVAGSACVKAVIDLR
ncbi:zinc-dependent alcohol dehydrogenase family protein [Amnibacterium sp.]|uniref:zinc-dependent alcohol dehydrogenase family protein n=1 Tax=Amnibacterium sp. TaxID=1872496 RepID=UPI002609BEE8|nr:zinc-dependent alcohol dehydrogenase family protein [Amnibacterium sp.]MCU1474817.1 hypothetical protein [Amnibacterium sp.]